MGCCQAKAPRTIASQPPTFNEGTAQWSPYTDDLAQVVPTFEGETKADGEKKFYTWDRNAQLPIRYAASGFASKEETPAKTVTQLFKEAATGIHAKDIAMSKEDLPPLNKGDKPPGMTKRDEWTLNWTWEEYYADCRKVGKSLLTEGINMQPKDSVCIFGFNSPEWIMGALGATLAGGCSAGIYPTDTAQQVEYKACHSGAVVAFVESPKKVQLFLDAQPNLPKLKAIVVWAPGTDVLPTGKAVPVYSWKDFLALGETVEDSVLDKREDEQVPGSACTYIYTSGTTGRPKAVMVSHDNIIYLASTVKKHVQDDTVFGTRGQERVISYLPLSHVAGMMVDIILPLVGTANNPTGWMTICFARAYDLKLGTIGDRLRAIQPSLFLGVPRVWEKMQDKILLMSKKNPQTGFKLKVKDWAKASAFHNAKNSQIGGTGEYPPNQLGGLLGHDFFDKKVLSMVAAKLGLDKCVFHGTAAAPMKQSTMDFFAAIGIELCEIYGMSESTGATTFSSPSAHKWGSVGWAVAGAEVKILNAYRDAEGNLIKTATENKLWDEMSGKKPTDYDDLDHEEKKDKNPADYHQGEICYRGRHIMMGYMANPDMGAAHVAEIVAKNEGAIDKDGWLRSGDKGTKDTLQLVRITGRYKELIIGAGGENVAPIPVEDALTEICPAVSSCTLVGNKQPYCIALITLKAVGANNEVPGTDELDLEAKDLGADCGVKTISDAIASEAFQAKIDAYIKQVNANKSAVPKPPSSIKRWTILPTNYAISTGELTPTQKLKRSFVEDKYKDVIAKVYAKEGRVTYVSSK